MPAPEILSFGDGVNQVGETGLVIDGGGFGAFPGSCWIYENADRTGAADQLPVGAWNDIQLTGVDIPPGANNTPGARYLFLQREDLAWSQAFLFTLELTTNIAPAERVVAPATSSIAVLAAESAIVIAARPIEV